MQDRLDDVLGPAPGSAADPESEDEAFEQVRDRVQALISAARMLSDTCADLADALRPVPGMAPDDPVLAGYGRLRAERTAALLDEAASAARGTLGLLHSAYGALIDRVGPSSPQSATGTWPDAFVEVQSRAFTIDDEAGTAVARPWGLRATSPDATDPHGIPTVASAVAEDVGDSTGSHARPATEAAAESTRSRARPDDVQVAEDAAVEPEPAETAVAPGPPMETTPVGDEEPAAGPDAIDGEGLRAWASPARFRPEIADTAEPGSPGDSAADEGVSPQAADAPAELGLGTADQGIAEPDPSMRGLLDEEGAERDTRDVSDQAVATPGPYMQSAAEPGADEPRAGQGTVEQRAAEQVAVGQGTSERGAREQVASELGVGELGALRGAALAAAGHGAGEHGAAQQGAAGEAAAAHGASDLGGASDPGVGERVGDELGASQLDASQLGASQLGTDELGASQLGTDELAEDELAGDELAGDELAGDELAGDEPARDEPARDERGADELAPREWSADELDGDKQAAGELAAPESGTGELAAPESGTGELAAPESGTGELAAPESGAGELAAEWVTGELATPESGAGELAAEWVTGELATPEWGTGELAAPEWGTRELAAPELGAGERAADERAADERGPGERGPGELGAGGWDDAREGERDVVDGGAGEEAGTVGEHTRDDIAIPVGTGHDPVEDAHTADDLDGEGLRGWAAGAAPARTEVAAAALAGWIVVDPDDADDPGHPIRERTVAAAPSVERLTVPVEDAEHGDSVSAEPRSLSLVPPVPDEPTATAAPDPWAAPSDWSDSDLSGASAFARPDRPVWTPEPDEPAVFPLPSVNPATAPAPEPPLDEPDAAILARQVEAARRHLQAALVVANGPAAPRRLGALLTAIEQVLTAVTDLARETRGLLESGLADRTFPGEARFLCSTPWEGTSLVGRDAYGDDVATPAGLAKLLRALGYEAHSVTSAGGAAGVQIRGPRYAMQVALVEPAGGGRQRWSGALEWTDESGADRTWAETLGPVELEDEELARRVDELLRRSVGG